MTFNLDPASPERNLHHTMPFRSQDDVYDAVLGLPYDQCKHGFYPGEHDCATAPDPVIKPVVIDGTVDMTEVPF